MNNIEFDTVINIAVSEGIKMKKLPPNFELSEFGRQVLMKRLVTLEKEFVDNCIVDFICGYAYGKNDHLLEAMN